MKTEVIELPFIIEDFEVGDRVYFHDVTKNHSSLGTVWSVNADDVTVTMDDDWMVRRAPVSMFKKMDGEFTPRADFWGKALPMKELEEGSIISYASRGFKTLASVKSISESKIRLAYQDDDEAQDEIISSNENRSIEYALLFWELEG